MVLFRLLINVKFCKKEKIKSLNRQFREIKFPANTIFLRDREIKDSRNVPRKFSRNLSPAKIKENKVTPSAKQRRNPCSGLPAVYPDLSTRHDWPVKKGLCFVCRDRQSG